MAGHDQAHAPQALSDDSARPAIGMTSARWRKVRLTAVWLLSATPFTLLFWDTYMLPSLVLSGVNLVVLLYLFLVFVVAEKLDLDTWWQYAGSLIVLLLALVLALGATAVAVGRATPRGRRPWLPLAVGWLGVALPQYVVRPEITIRSVAATLLLLAPLGVTALAADAEVRRGCSLWRASSVAVLLGVTVGVATPFLLSYLLRLLCAAVSGCG